MFRKYFNQNGFTLIEALILAGLLGVLITTFASYQYQRNKQNKARETRNEYTQLQNNLKSSIGQTESLTQAEDREYARLATPGPTGTPTPSVPPDATPNFCPAGCTYDPLQYACVSADPECYTNNTCVKGCTIPGIYTSTTTATNGGGNNGGGNNGGGNNGGGNNGGATPTPVDPHGVKCQIPFCHLTNSYVTICYNDGTRGMDGPFDSCAKEDGGGGGDCGTCKLHGGVGTPTSPTPYCKPPLILETGTNMCCCPEGSTPQTCNGPTCFLHP